MAAWSYERSVPTIINTRAPMMMIAFITIKSSLVPLIEGLCARVDPSTLIVLHDSKGIFFRMTIMPMCVGP